MNAAARLDDDPISRRAARAAALAVLVGALFALATALASAQSPPPQQISAPSGLPEQGPGESVGGFAFLQNAQTQAVPGKPTGLTLASPGPSGQLKVTWTIAATDNPTHYTIRRWHWSNGSWASMPDVEITEADTSSNGDNRSYTLTGLTDYNWYGIRVKTKNSSGYGDSSDFKYISLAPTYAPTGVTLAAPGASGSLQVSWTAPTSTPTGKTVASYQVEYAKWDCTGNCGYKNPQYATSTTTQHTLTGLVDFSYYQIRVRPNYGTANDWGVWSGASSKLLVPAPSQLWLTYSGKSGELKVEWVPGGSSPTKYQIAYCKLASGACPANGWQSTNVNESSDLTPTNPLVREYTLTGLDDFATYSVAVKTAVNTEWSAFSATQTATLEPVPTVHVFNAGSGKIDVEWEVDADPDDKWDDYDIQYVDYCFGTDPDTSEPCYNNPPNTNTFTNPDGNSQSWMDWGTSTDTFTSSCTGNPRLKCEERVTGLTNDKTYWFRVRAGKSSKYGPWKISSSGAAPKAPVPGAPSTLLLLPGPESDQLRVTWALVKWQNDADAPTKHQVAYKLCSGACPTTAPDSSWTITELTDAQVPDPLIEGGEQRRHTIPGLTAGSTYAVAVRSANDHDSDGNDDWGGWSAVHSQTLVPVLTRFVSRVDNAAADGQKRVYEVTFTQEVTVDDNSGANKPYIPMGVNCPDPRSAAHDGYKADYVSTTYDSDSDTSTLTFRGPLQTTGGNALGHGNCIHLKTGNNSHPTIQNASGQTAIAEDPVGGTPNLPNLPFDRALRLTPKIDSKTHTFVETYRYTYPGGFPAQQPTPTFDSNDPDAHAEEWAIVVYDYSDDFAENESVAVTKDGEKQFKFTIDWSCKYENDTAKRWDGDSWEAATDTACSVNTAYNTPRTFPIYWTNPPESGGDKRWVEFAWQRNQGTKTVTRWTAPVSFVKVTYSFLRSARLLAQDRAELEASVCRSDVAPVSPDSPGPITLKIPTTERTCVIRCERDPGEGHLPCGSVTFNANIFNVFNHLDSTIKDRMVGVYAVPSQTWGYAHRETSYQPWYNGRTAFTISNHRYITPWLSPVYDFQLYAIYERKDLEEWTDAPNRSRRIAGALSEPINVCLPAPQGEGIPLIARYNGKYNPDDDGNYAADADLMSPFDADSDIYGDSSLYLPYWELMRGQPTASPQLICAQISDLDYGPGSLYTTSLAGEVAAAISPVDEQGNATWMASVPIKASEFLAALPNYSGVIYYDQGVAQSYGVSASTIGLDDGVLISAVGDFEIPPGAAINLVPAATDFTIADADSSPETPPMPGG